jgi:putative ABC transport system permease protein
MKDFAYVITNIFANGLYEGLSLAPVVLSMVLTFRILRFPDVTMDGSFVTGSAAAALAIVRLGLDPYSACIIALLCGAAAGLITAFLHVTLRIDRLLAGVLTAFVLYSLNLLVLHSSLNFTSHGTALSPFEHWDALFRNSLPRQLNLHISSLCFFLVVAVLCKLMVDLFLATETGLALRAAGSNEQVLRNIGANPVLYKFIGLALGNALVALSGALVAQKEGVANSQRGIGMIIFALTAYILGEQLLLLIRRVVAKSKAKWAKSASPSPPHLSSCAALTASALVGTVFYSMMVQLGYAAQLRPELPKLLLGVYIILAIGDKSWFAMVRTHFHRH